MKRDFLIKQLEKDQKIIARWKSGTDFATNIIQVQDLETYVENEWKWDKKKIEVSNTSSTDESMDNDHRLKDEHSTINIWELSVEKQIISWQENSHKSQKERWSCWLKNFKKDCSNTKVV